MRLAAEAIRGMEGGSFVVELSGPGGTPGAELAAAIAAAAGLEPRAVRLERATDGAPGGLKVLDAEGRQLWDNGLLERLRRNWPVLRSAVALQTGLLERGPERVEEGTS